MVDSSALSRWQRLLHAGCLLITMVVPIGCNQFSTLGVKGPDPVDCQLDACIGLLDLPEAFSRLPSSQSR
ncbi:MAG: hypothetical protein VX970_12070 [Planctomycetota bacterium]|nr:hypothetical protein [Planctomycetota bacterium]